MDDSSPGVPNSTTAVMLRQLLRGEGKSRVLGPGRFSVLPAFPDRTVIAWEHQGQTFVQVVDR